MTDSELLTIAIPCLNEARNLDATLADIHEIIPKLPFDVDVVMIDDGSTDDTVEVMERLSHTCPRTRYIKNPRNLGPGESVLRMYDRVDEASWFCALPGDNEIVASSLLNYAPMAANHDIILGYLHNTVIRTPVRRLASAAFTGVARAAYGLRYRYLNGPKLYRVRAFKGIDVVAGGHGFNAELLAKAILRDPTLRITEAPFVARGRAVGSSTAFTPKNIRRAVVEFAAGYRSVVDYRDKVVRMSEAGKPS